jgi:hypothetical protein
LSYDDQIPEGGQLQAISGCDHNREIELDSNRSGSRGGSLVLLFVTPFRSSPVLMRTELFTLRAFLVPHWAGRSPNWFGVSLRIPVRPANRALLRKLRAIEMAARERSSESKLPAAGDRQEATL